MQNAARETDKKDLQQKRYRKATARWHAKLTPKQKENIKQKDANAHERHLVRMSVAKREEVQAKDRARKKKDSSSK